MPLDTEAVADEIKRVSWALGMDLADLDIEITESREGLHKLVLPWTVTKEFLEDNPDGTTAGDMVLRVMSIQMGTDLADLIINGDTQTHDRLLIRFDGLLKLKLKPSDMVFKLALGDLERVYVMERQEYNYLYTLYAGLDYKVQPEELNVEVLFRTYDID